MPTETSSASARGHAAAGHSARRGWPAVIAVTVGIFSIVTTEILPIGLLTQVRATFEVSAGTAGWTMLAPGIVAAVAAPLVTAAAGRIDRRVLLCALMALLAAADLLAAVAPSYGVMLFSRVLVGLTIGGFWSVGAGLAARLVPEGSVGAATAVIFSAVPLGSVLGVPAGTLIGGLVGWRASFVVMGVLTVGVLAALVLLLPPLPAERATGLRELGAALRLPHVRTGLAVTLLAVTAHFGAYTYITPFLREVTGVGSVQATAYLLAYGAAGVVGNFLVSAAAARGVRAAFAVAACLLAAATLLLPVLGAGAVGALGLLLVWGLAYGAVPVCAQTWFVRSIPRSPEAATVVFTASFQATIAIGALLGGVVVDAYSPSAVMWGGGAVAVVLAVTLLLCPGPERPRARSGHM